MLHYTVRSENRNAIAISGYVGGRVVSGAMVPLQELRCGSARLSAGIRQSVALFVQLVTEEAEWFRREGVIGDGERIVATHFSPHHGPPHQQTTEYLAGFGIEAAWDGMEIIL